MEQLFGSKTRTKLLKLFLTNPNRSFYVREITRKIEEQINSVRRELANLLSLGVITSDSSNNKLYYEVNQKYEHYNALRELFTGKKESAPEKVEKSDKQKSSKEETKEEPEKVTKEKVFTSDVDKKIWSKVGNIFGLLYSGVFTRDDKSPVDVLIVGDVTVSAAEGAVAELEKQEGKELRYAIIEVEEWKYRSQINDKFWSDISQSKNQIIIDKSELFSE